jgi:hypothetical protein
MTPMPPAPGTRCIPPRPAPRPVPITPAEPKGDNARTPVRGPAAPPDIDDIPPDNGDSLKADRAGPIGAAGRDRNDNEEPPPMRLGMNPSNVPP